MPLKLLGESFAILGHRSMQPRPALILTLLNWLYIQAMISVYLSMEIKQSEVEDIKCLTVLVKCAILIVVNTYYFSFAPTISTIINHCIRVAPSTEDSISNILGKEDNNSTFAEVMASVDPFQRIISPPESLPQSNASTVHALKQAENTTSETATQFDLPNLAISSEEREEKDLNGLSRIFRDDQVTLLSKYW